MSTTNSTTSQQQQQNSDQSDHALDQLLPTLVECFAIILCGYVSGRLKWLSKGNASGINFFATNFALPSLLFLSLATLEFRDVNWLFVAGITLSKMIVFLGVALAVALLVKPANLSSIAIYAIFCTHVNDYGFAFPILQAVYHEKKPMYPSYIYIIGLISLVILNPIGFFIMEVERAMAENRAANDDDSAPGTGPSRTRRRSSLEAAAAARTSCKRILSTYGIVAKRILTNPNVFMTLFGIIANLSFKGNMPVMISGIFKIFSDTFQGSVLFVLGFQVVGAGAAVTDKVNYFIPGIMIAVKMLLTPLITRGCVQLFNHQESDSSDLADYGFLYGTVPTAPVVLLYASQYGIPTEMLATALVLCTLLSGPIMYVSAKLLAVQAYAILEYTVQLKETILCLSVLGLMASLWVTILFGISKRWKRSPHSVTQCLIISQAVMGLGLLIWSTNSTNNKLGDWKSYVEVIAVTGGQLSSRFWTAFVAISLCIRQRHGKNWKLMPYFLALGFGLPILAIVSLVFTTKLQEVIIHQNEIVPSFLFGENEACITVVVLAFCLVTTVGCLLVYFRLDQNEKKMKNLKKISNSSIVTGQSECSGFGKSTDTLQTIKESEEPVTDEYSLSGVSGITQRTIESPPPNDFQISAAAKSIEIESVVHPRNANSSSFKEERVTAIEIKEMQSLHHVTLLLLLSVSMMVGFTTSIWKLLDETRSGIFVALEFLDVVLNYGQALFCFVVFGRDVHFIVIPIAKQWHKFQARNNRSATPPYSLENYNEDSRYVCFQFIVYHYQKCSEQLPRDKVWKRKICSGVFWGWEFVNWILRQGISKNRREAEKYGHLLFKAKIIQFAKKKDEKINQFIDGPYFYVLSKDESIT